MQRAAKNDCSGFVRAVALAVGVGYLVVAGKKEAGHGHVVIIVPGEGPHKTAMGYWGRLGGIGFKNKGLDFAWKRADLADVQYFAKPVPNLRAKP